jgi:hypothetical protein
MAMYDVGWRRMGGGAARDGGGRLIKIAAFRILHPSNTLHPVDPSPEII